MFLFLSNRICGGVTIESLVSYLRAATDNTVEWTIDGSRAYMTYLFCIKRLWNFVDFVIMVLFLSEN
jgi:hypothetical protein